MKLTSRIAAAACGVIAATVGSVALADYPEKPIEVIIPYGPGSNSDATGRLFVNAMAEVMNGARLVPLNVDGAGGTIGTAQLAAARNDGYSIGFNPIATVTIQPHLRPLPYGKDSFEPICMIANTPAAVMVAPDSPYQTMEELIAAAADGIVVAVGPAPGSLPHIVQGAVAKSYGVNFTYLPSGGGGKAATSVLGGEATLSTDAYSAGNSFGLRTLAVLADERVAALPDVPTLKELGHDVSLSVWFGAFAPAGTPADVLDTLSAACEEAVKMPSLIDGLAAANHLISYRNREDFTAFYNEQFDVNRELLALIGLAK